MWVPPRMAVPPVMAKPPAPREPQDEGTPAAMEAAGDESADQAEGGLRELIRKAAGGYPAQPVIEIEGYHLESVLGQGGMGVVYKATRLLDEFPVAIKVMQPKATLSEKSRLRFLREIDVIRSLNHPNIVTLVASGSVGSSFYFVMDCCSGGSLSDHASRRGGRIALPVLGPFMLQCLAGLEHAHLHGFVHRDIKPANILLHQQGRGWMAKLSDFGLAKQFEQAGFSGMTLTGAVGGTCDYMPREQLTDFKAVRPVSDVWSIAATFYRLLTGASPREGGEGRDPMEVVLCDEAMPLRQREPSVPPRVAEVVDRALNTEPSQRFQDASHLRQALEEVL